MNRFDELNKVGQKKEREMGEGGGGVRYMSQHGEYQRWNKLTTRQLEEDTTETQSKSETQRYRGDGLESDQSGASYDLRANKCRTIQAFW